MHQGSHTGDVFFGAFLLPSKSLSWSLFFRLERVEERDMAKLKDEPGIRGDQVWNICFHLYVSPSE